MEILYARGENEFAVVASTSRSQAAELTIQPGDSVGGPENRHGGADQWVFVVRGHGEATVAGRQVVLEPGVLLLIEAGEGHELRNTADGPLVSLSVYAPPEY